MKVLFTPRDANPYQHELAAELAARGVAVTFLPERTLSHTLNVLLMPFELLVARARGHAVLHIHWVYRFALPGRERVPVLRRLARAWFGLVLTTARMVGLRIVWTAHNVLPHSRVFDDDVAGRRRLLEAVDAVIVHAEPTLDALRALGPLPSLTATIPQGPVHEAVAGTGDRRAELDIPRDARCVGMVGRLEAYKGVRELVEAFERVPGAALRLLLAGECADPDLRDWLVGRAVDDPRIVLDLGRVPDDQFGASLRSLDVGVMPFRSITNSGSALAVLAAKVPLLLPADGSLHDLPTSAAQRYSVLEDGLVWARDAPFEELRRFSDAAAAAFDGRTWADVAGATHQVYAGLTESPVSHLSAFEAAS